MERVNEEGSELNDRLDNLRNFSSGSPLMADGGSEHPLGSFSHGTIRVSENPKNPKLPEWNHTHIGLKAGVSNSSSLGFVDLDDLAARMARLTGQGAGKNGALDSRYADGVVSSMEDHNMNPNAKGSLNNRSHPACSSSLYTTSASVSEQHMDARDSNLSKIGGGLSPNSATTAIGYDGGQTHTQCTFLNVLSGSMDAADHGVLNVSKSDSNIAANMPIGDVNGDKEHPNPKPGVQEDSVNGNSHADGASKVNPNRGYNVADIAKAFDVSLSTTHDIDKFVKELQEGKFPSWSTFPVEISNEIIEVVCARYEVLSKLEAMLQPRADQEDVEETTWSQNGVRNYTSTTQIGGSTIGAIDDLNSPIIKSVDVGTNVKVTSYAGAAGLASSPNKPAERLIIDSMISEDRFEGVNVSIPRKVVEKVSARFTNTLYGYFIGKRVAFPVVEYYAKTNWAKFGLKRIMMNANGFFFFKFDTQTGYEAVLEGGPWMIRNSPIILKKWTIKTSLRKDELTRVPVWVKLHDVPIQVFEEEGISLIATYLGKPLMLDSFTTTMCKESWGRSSFARCLIEIDSGSELKENISIGVPDLDGPGFTKETIRVEYEWKPPRCPSCVIFGHSADSCPKRIPTVPVATKSVVNMQDDGFQQVRSRKRGNKGNAGIPLPKGVPLSKGFQVGKGFLFNPKAPSGAPSGDVNRGKNGTNAAIAQNEHNAQSMKKSLDKGKSIDDKDMESNHGVYTSPNAFSVLDTDDEDEDVENIYDESANLLNANGSQSSMDAKS